MTLDVTLDRTTLDRLQRRTLTVVVVTQVFGGLGLAAGVTVGALLARDLLGGDAWAGLPAAMMTLGAAVSAYTVGRISQRAGRRAGLTGGFLVGAAGAAGVVAAAVWDRPVLLFASLALYGAGTSTNLQARYAGTDLARPDRRGTAVSTAMVATTFGAVVGPNSVEATGRLAQEWGMPALTGPFLLSGTAFSLAGAVLFVFLRPDPLRVARSLPDVPNATAEDELEDGVQPAPLPTVDPAATRRLFTGATAMVLTQLAMVAVMTMTPVHMSHHGHGLGDIGFVISAHVAAMFLPSPLTGRLVDRLGRMPMVIASGVTLLAAGLLAAAAPGDSMVLLTLALALLGLGWNFGLIAGTALVVDATPVQTRARTQGALDVLVALAGATGGAASGWIVAGADYATLALCGGLLSLALVPVVVWAERPRPARS